MAETDVSHAEAAPNGPGDASRSTLARLFIGSQGLRAGWSLILFFVLAFGIGAAIVSGMRAVTTPLPKIPANDALRLMRDEIVPTVAVFTAALIMAAIERRRFSDFGIKRQKSIPDFVTGLLWGVAMLSVLVGLLLVAGATSIDGIALSNTDALTWGAQWALVFLLVGLFEEFLLRGYLQFTLARGIAGIVRWVAPSSNGAATVGWMIAALLLSVVLFAALHLGNGGENAVGIAGVALAGIAFAYPLWRTGSLWWGIGFHAGWDWAQTYLFGTADSGTVAAGHLLNSHPIGNPLLSGGSAGPEGSVLLLPVMLATLGIVRFTLPKRRPE